MFCTKKEAASFCSNLLKNHPLYTNLSGDNLDKITFILRGHEDREEKIGVGIKHIFIAPTIYKSVGFFIKRLDDTIIDFSYKSCLYPPTLNMRFNEAYRNAIAFEIDAFTYKDNKCSLKKSKCDSCGKDAGLFEVHHSGKYTIKYQIADFIKKHNITIKPDMFETSELFIEMFKDQNLVENIINYHNAFSSLKILCKPCHIKEHSKKDLL